MKKDERPRADLLGEQDFLQRVARRIARDEWEADDLVQEAWVSALEKPPDPERSPRPWFRTVLSRHLLQRVRSGRRRREREQRFVGREEVLARAASEEAERRDAANALWSSIEELGEPYRETLRLRYREELDVATVAERLGVPPETVRSRVRRGLAQLRERLSSERAGGRDEWLVGIALLAGLPRPPRSAPASPTRPWLHSFGGLGALAAALVVAVVAVTLWLARETPEPVPALARAEAALPAPDAPAPAEPAAERANVEPTGAATARLDLRVVVEHTGEPLEGAPVEVREGTGNRQAGTTDERGRLDVAVPVDRSLTVAVGETETTRPRSVEARVAPEDAGDSAALVVAVGAVTTVEGKVEAPDGSPAARARVLAIEGEFPSFLPGDGLKALSETRTDERGRFTLRRVPVESGLLAWSDDEVSFARYGHPLAVRCNDPYWSTSLPRTPNDYLDARGDVLLRLRDAAWVDVRVTGPGSLPLEGTLVTCKGSGYTLRRHTTDAAGRARLGPFVTGRSLVVSVRHEGHATAFVEPFVVHPALRAVEVELAPARTIDGWVQDRAGRPIEGARVVAAVDRGRDALVLDEDDEEGRRFVRSADRLPLGLQPELGGPVAFTDELGAFTLGDVDAEEWRVQADVGGALLGELVARGGDRGLVVKEDGGERPVVLHGAVLDAETGEAVRGALVWAERRRGDDDERVGGTGRRFENAEWRLALPEPGDWTVLATAEGYAPFRSDPTPCGPGEHRIDVELLPARDVLLRVDDLRGPLPGTLVVPRRQSASGDFDFYGFTVTTDARGVARLEDVPTTAFEVVLHAFGKVRPPVLEVPAGDFAEEPHVLRIDADCSSRRYRVPLELLDAESGERIFSQDTLELDVDLFDADGVHVLNFHTANRPPELRRALKLRARLRVPVAEEDGVRVVESAAPDPYFWLGPGPYFVDGDRRTLPDLLLPAGRLRVVVTAERFEAPESVFDVDPELGIQALRLRLTRAERDE